MTAPFLQKVPDRITPARVTRSKSYEPLLPVPLDGVALKDPYTYALVSVLNTSKPSITRRQFWFLLKR